MNLREYGYTDYFKSKFDEIHADSMVAARVIAEHKSGYIIVTDFGEMPAALSGKYRYRLDENGGYPIVGDYAAVRLSEQCDRAAIHELLPRRTCFFRRDSWVASGMQFLCSNFDTVFICMSLNRDYNIARLERYLIMAKESGADIAVILTKADLCRDAEIKTAMCEAVCRDVPVHAISAQTGEGVDGLMRYFEQGKTVVALGSSGVGKSTLVNALSGVEIMKTGALRDDDDRGRHTTVHREIIRLPSGGLYLDTPGLREIGLAEAEGAVTDMFSDIGQLMQACRFSDCHHGNEPGCAVRAAIDGGEITQERYEQYLQYKKEARYSEDKKGYIRERTAFFKSVARYSKSTKRQGKEGK